MAPAYASESIGQVIFESIVDLLGDYNGNGVVDAADYVAWRNNPSAFGGATGYDTWKANFGKTLGAGSVASTGNLSAIPEPTAGLLCGLTIVFVFAARRDLRRGQA